MTYRKHCEDHKIPMQRLLDETTLKDLERRPGEGMELEPSADDDAPYDPNDVEGPDDEAVFQPDEVRAGSKD